MMYLLILLLVALAIPLIVEARRKPMNANARRDAPGEFAALSQGVTHFQWIGPMRGPVAVCVHGLTTPSLVWQGVAQGLAKRGFRVLVYDIYGRGYSDRVKGLQDQAFLNKQLSDLLEDQEVEGDITLLGYSMGGAVATGFAAAHGDKLRQLVLLAPAGMGRQAKGLERFIIRTPVVGDWLMLALFPRSHRKGVEVERDLVSSVDNIVDLQLKELNFRGFVSAVLSGLRGILSHPLKEQHKTVHQAGIPVLAIWGKEDSVISQSGLGVLAQWNRHARQDVIEGAGHGLPYTHTNQVLASIADALQDESS
ncbi:MAG: alpha/beta hydrolase [Rhodobacteraceae bacterium]|nr:alpha/beta hydrolase [Paracoccaceae bacterium]